MDTAQEQRQDPADSGALADEISRLGPWFHNIHLGGVATAPNHFLGDYPNMKWSRFKHALPHDLTGLSVLDIGCNAGFYSVEMKRRGAKEVLGVDEDARYLAQASLVRHVLGVDIELKQMSVYDLPSLRRKFDVVLFMGVLYHLRHPLLALDLLSEHVVGDTMVFQSMQRGSRQVVPVKDDYPFSETEIFNEPGYPKMHFIEHRYSDDPTNWWVPNRACVEAMLRSAGFSIESQPEEEVYICKKRRAR